MKKYPSILGYDNKTVYYHRSKKILKSKLPPKNILLMSCMKMEKQIALSYSTANHFFAHETRPLVIQLLFSTTPISGRPPSHAIPVQILFYIAFICKLYAYLYLIRRHFLITLYSSLHYRHNKWIRMFLLTTFYHLSMPPEFLSIV